MLKAKPVEQLDLFIEEIRAARVKAVTIRQFNGINNLISKSNIQVSYENRFAFGWSRDLGENKKVDSITITVEGDEAIYYNDFSLDEFEIFKTDDGFDIEMKFEGTSTTVSITTA